MGLTIATVVAFAGGEQGEGTNRLAGVALAVVALAAPTAAMYMAILAGRAGEHSAGAVLAWSTFLGVLVLLALPIAVVSGEAVVAAVGVCVIGIVIALYARSHMIHE